MLQKVPKDIEGFNTFITQTDDCQLKLRENTIYVLTAEGKNDWLNKDNKKVNEPCWKIWGWTEEESQQWSKFRSIHVELYKQYCTAEGSEKNKLLGSLNENMNACIAYDKEHKLVYRVMFCNNTYGVDREIFGIQQDVMEFETPMRKISFLYEKQVPFSDFEKELIDKYVRMHKEFPETKERLLKELKRLNDQMPGFWENIFESKVKFDKATNSICLPHPVMEGSYSPVISFYMPTDKELKGYIDDCNNYIGNLYYNINEFFKNTNLVYDEVYGKYEHDDETDESPKDLDDEVHEMINQLIDMPGCSLELCSIDEDYQDFLGVMSDDNKVVENAYDEFIKKENVLNNMFGLLTTFLNERNSPKEEEDDDASDQESGSEDRHFNMEVDELRQETIQRYEANKDNVYLDTQDWHIILDNFEQKRDTKSKAAALKKALTQHPEEETLLLRKANEEIDKHEYKKAQDIIKYIEDNAKIPGHHPNFWLSKANIYIKLHSPNEAIPLYNKLINAEGIGMEWYHEHCREFLIDIYKEQGNYAECLRLIKELLELKPNDENLISRLSFYYRKNEMIKEAEETLLKYLEEHPESTDCIEQLGHLYSETKEPKKAIDLYDKSYELNKEENYTILYSKGNLHMELKQFDEAAICFEACILHYYLDKDFHLAAIKCFTELNMPYVVEYHQHKLVDLDPELTETLKHIQPSGN